MPSSPVTIPYALTFPAKRSHYKRRIDRMTEDIARIGDTASIVPLAPLPIQSPNDRKSQGSA
jgi:hypothetical protein